MLGSGGIKRSLRREPDLTGIYFENSQMALSADSWYSWLSLSGFFDQTRDYSLDVAKTEEPWYYVIDKKTKDAEGQHLAKLYILDYACYQAPAVTKVGMCRVNNASLYLEQAFEKLSQKKRRVEEQEKAQERAEILYDTVMLEALDKELN